MENHFNTALTNVDRPEDILREKLYTVSAQLKAHSGAFSVIYTMHSWNKRQTVGGNKQELHSEILELTVRYESWKNFLASS